MELLYLYLMFWPTYGPTYMEETKAVANSVTVALHTNSITDKTPQIRKSNKSLVEMGYIRSNAWENPECMLDT